MNYRVLVLLFFTALLLQLSVGKAPAMIAGKCANCHTIHNSQDGQPVAYKLNDTFSDFETDEIPRDGLLKTNCVGCHTSTSSDTIVDNTPIIFNTTSFTNPLAGGNFFYVRNNDAYGHNVVDIAATDADLGFTPPGGLVMSSQLSCAGEFGCHGDTSPGLNDVKGVKGAHHRNDWGPIDGNTVYQSYRFLNGILGKEDADWEQDNTNTSHNEYKGSTGSSTDTISYLCAKCHGNFHTWEGGSTEVGTASPWFRHPTDIALKNSGEYTSYINYSMTAPLARPDPDNVSDTSEVTPGTDIIMCLSCHRAHASPYYKMLRWDYKSSTLSTALSGCNVCHTSKN